MEIQYDNEMHSKQVDMSPLRPCWRCCPALPWQLSRSLKCSGCSSRVRTNRPSRRRATADPASTLPRRAVAAEARSQRSRGRGADAAARAATQPSWRLIGESGEALIANDAGRAIELARRAIEADGGNPFAHYQLGLAAAKASDWGTAVSGFTKAIELKPDFAYAHYYAALAYQRQRQLPKTAEHFDAFLRLAPDAPERSAVIAILRTIK